MTTLIFVRHGQSEANFQKVFAGHLNVPLTELGKKQAENTAHYLKDYPIERIYASDLTRAWQTALPTAEQFGLDIISDSFLREIYAGDWEGLSYETLKLKYPVEYGQIWINDTGHAHPNNGESVVELSQRIYSEVDRLIAENPSRCVAVFTHATPIRLLFAKWKGIEPENLSSVPFVPNASVSVVDYAEDGSFEVRLCGYDGHQGDCATKFPKGVV